MRYKLIEIDNSEHNQPKKTTLLIRDDGHRIHCKYIDGPVTEPELDWVHVMEYKQCDIGAWADAIVNILMAGSIGE